MHQIALQRFQHKIQRPQAQNGEHHRAVHNQRLFGHRNHRRHAVKRKHHVRQLNHRQTQKQRRRHPLPLFHRLRMVVFRMLRIFARQFQMRFGMAGLRFCQFFRVQKEIVPIKAREHGEKPMHPAVCQVVGIILAFLFFFFVLLFQHHHGGIAHRRRKKQLHPSA